MALLAMMLTAPAAWAQSFSGGTGTQADPYLISTHADLTALANHVNSGSGGYSGTWFKQTADIDMNGVNWTPIGDIEGSTGTHRFYGNYDGNHKRISNLSYNGSGVGGLFGYVGNSSGTANTLKTSASRIAALPAPTVMLPVSSYPPPTATSNTAR